MPLISQSFVDIYFCVLLEQEKHCHLAAKCTELAKNITLDTLVLFSGGKKCFQKTKSGFWAKLRNKNDKIREAILILFLGPKLLLKPAKPQNRFQT
jgi:hypothetical protein